MKERNESQNKCLTIMVSTVVITVDIIVPGIAIILKDVVYGNDNMKLRAKWRTRSRERIR